MLMRPIFRELKKERPVFHSEADFQFSLAWKIKETYPNAQIRLEKRISIQEKDIYVDIFAELNNQPLFIELKYKTKRLVTFFGGERFSLKEQSACDWGRWETVEAIQRVESAVSTTKNGHGMVILLTNDSSYWDPQKNLNDKTAHAQFRIHQGNRLNGTLKWGEKVPGKRNATHRDDVTLRGNYQFTWQRYSSTKNAEFKLLLIKV